MTESGRKRIKRLFYGVVQGVGFRPWIYRLAMAHQLTGWVANSARGAQLEVEGAAVDVQRFLDASDHPPAPIQIFAAETIWLDPTDGGYVGFEIRPSLHSDGMHAIILPDIATCSDCLSELFDPHDRRFLYSFLNCTHCGPRFSIIHQIPYDRERTTMSGFPLCDECRREFNDPRDRRFHAQPIACPVCGPHLEYRDVAGRVEEGDAAALQYAADLVTGGGILAIKGLGGFQLLVDARSEQAVSRLRLRKMREAKPLAIMVSGLEQALELAEVNRRERHLLTSRMAPIVLVKKRPENCIADSVAPGNHELGMMLPYTPLHHLLVRKLGFPIVATSGNLSGDPIETETKRAMARLGAIADGFLVHDRPIARAVDDSVVRVAVDRTQVLRRARGYAPLPLSCHSSVEGRFAVGGQLKNSVAIGTSDGVFMSPHIGDLDSVAAIEAHKSASVDLFTLFPSDLHSVCRDLHPDYESSRVADRMKVRSVLIQHHVAHLASVVAEHELPLPVLGVAWDGTGYGVDGHVWGGEFISLAEGDWRRVTSLRPFRLPGGDLAIREPRRVLLGLLFELFGPGFGGFGWLGSLGFSTSSLKVFEQMLERDVQTPWCTSIGRLFDALAALADLCLVNRFEGEAAMLLENSLCGACWDEGGVPFPRVSVAREFLGLPGTPQYWLDWGPLLKRLVAGQRPAPMAVASGLHRDLVATAVEVAQDFKSMPVVLSGGCFQNRNLLEHLVAELEARGIRAYWNQIVPPNDGCLSYGQLAADAYGWVC